MGGEHHFHYSGLFLFLTSFQGLERGSSSGTAGKLRCASTHFPCIGSADFPAATSRKAVTVLMRLWFLFKQQISRISLME